MHFALFISALSIYFIQINSTIYKENITDFSKCKTHFSTSEGKYTDFFQIINQESNSTKNLIVDLHFSVLAQSDAHILLTPSKRYNNKDPVYEIVLGAGRNSYSSIRRAIRTNIKATIRHQTKLLSFYEAKSFWVHVSRNGLIEVGRETEDLPFLTWIDPDPIPLEFFSLSTWPGIEAKWFYDCYKVDVKEAGRVLNDRERLVEDYLKNYSIFDVPTSKKDDKIDVFLNLKPIFMNLNEPERKLESRFILTQKWIDSKLQWNSTNYGNIQSIQPHIYQIWTPNTRFFSVVDDFEKSSKNTKLLLTQNGEVTLQANLELKTWCNPADLDDWPNDKHICVFPIGVFVDSDKINIHYDNSSSETNKNTVKNLVYKTEWDIESVNLKNGYIENNEKIDFEIVYRLKKISDIYFTIYFAPIIIISIGTLLTFWVSPLGGLKIALACFNLVLVTLICVTIAISLPGHPAKVPKILQAYSYGYLGITFSILLAILTINITRIKQKTLLPRILFQFLMSRGVQKGLMLTPTKGVIENPIQQSWMLLATFIDRISFIIYLTFYIIGFITLF